MPACHCQAFAGVGTALFELALRRHRFYPAGGGEALVHVQPPALSGATGLAPIDLMQRGASREAYAECLHAGLPKGVAEREMAVLKTGLGWADEQLRDRALMVVLKCEHITEVFASYGDKGLTAEQVARTLLHEVRAYQAHQAAVGPYLADQLMIPMALVGARGNRDGKGGHQCWTTQLRAHARTSAHVIERFLPIRFAMSPYQNGYMVRLEATTAP